jgi:predicted PurR-regulated permease PerM
VKKLLVVVSSLVLVVSIVVTVLSFLKGGQVLIRSYDRVGSQSNSTLYSIAVYYGGLEIQSASGPLEPGNDEDFEKPTTYRFDTFEPTQYPYSAFQYYTDFRLLGFQLSQGQFMGSEISNYTVPLYAIIVLVAIMPILSFYSWRKKRKHKEGNFCLHCGYDLRMTPDRCPECGNPVSAQR